MSASREAPPSHPDAPLQLDRPSPSERSRACVCDPSEPDPLDVVVFSAVRLHNSNETRALKFLDALCRFEHALGRYLAGTLRPIGARLLGGPAVGVVIEAPDLG